MNKISLAAAGLLAGLGACTAQARPLTIEDVATMSRIGSADASPGGHWLVWDQRETDMAANRGRTDLWRLDLTRKDAKPEKLAADPAVNESAPAFSADGRWVYFMSDKGGHQGVWRIAIEGARRRRSPAIRISAGSGCRPPMIGFWCGPIARSAPNRWAM